MKYVLDSSVAFKWLIPEADTPKALQLLDDMRTGAVELLSPDILCVETTHALTRAERQKRITPAQGAMLFTDLMNNLPPLESHLTLLPRAYAISSATRQGVYDCIYVALAEREACDLVTTDDKLIRNLRPTFPFILHLTSIP